MQAANVIASIDFRDKVYACWLGKNIGGTLGMPFEGVPSTMDLTEYEPSPAGAVANDDLDIQLIWLILLERHGLKLTSEHLVEAWKKHQVFAADEYGIARWNLRRGIAPPLSGVHNNWFRHGMGSAIRSEIWACIFPGQPAMAGRYAAFDAMIDHAGEGVWAEVFMSAMQSSAFNVNHAAVAIRIGLEQLPTHSRVAMVARELLALHEARYSHEDAIKTACTRWGSHNFTDCVMNLTFLMAALLWGDGDFESTILLAVNCGQDTDCTGASVGATMGILGGSGSIGSKWRKPIGETIAVSGHLQSLPMPMDIDELTDRTIALSREFSVEKMEAPLAGVIYEEPSDTIDDKVSWLACGLASIEGSLNAPATLEMDDNRSVQITSTSMFLNVDDVFSRDELTVYLQTHIVSEEDLRGWLMVTVNTGMSVWLDDELVMNYHGRREIVPAFHRTEGGVSIPIHLEKQQSRCLKIRLLGLPGRGPRICVVAIGDLNGDFALDTKIACLQLATCQ